MKLQLFNRPLHELLQLVLTEQVTVPDMVSAFYARVNEREPQVQAWQYLVPLEDYLAEYESKRGFYQQSMLKGLPFAIKDVIDTANIPTAMGSLVHQDRVPSMDAACVTALKAAGGILMGKTVTTEFAYFQAGKTNNPHDYNRTPGGSSSGSAAAVADFMVPIALGTQTAASVIRPAAYCGCVGYVGSVNEYSLRNIQPLSQSLDSLGIITNHVVDTQLVRNVLIQRSPDAVPQNLQDAYRFAVFTGESLGEIEAAMSGKLQALVTVLQPQHLLLGFDWQGEMTELTQLHSSIMAYEVARNLAFEAQSEGLSAHLKALIQQGLALPYIEYQKCVRRVAEIRQQLLEWWDENKVDFVIAPAAPGVAPNKTHGTGVPFMSRAWQMLGFPTVTLPLYYHGKLPLGLQLIGRPQQDDALLQAAQHIKTCVQ